MDSREIINEILEREGDRYTDDPTDPGGPTKYGITLATLTRYWHHIGRSGSPTAEDVQALTESEARTIYRAFYVAPFANVGNEVLEALMVDSGVQHGVERVAMWLQSACEAKQDGDIGPKTVAGIKATGYALVYRRVLAIRCRFYFADIHDNPSQAKYANGWGNRLASFIEVSP